MPRATPKPTLEAFGHFGDMFSNIFVQDAFSRVQGNLGIVLFGVQASPGRPLAKAKGSRLRTGVLG